jgi:central kinetochore subunit Mal2/MCM21
VQDPDPNAVGGGNVFGIRIDVFSTAKKQFLLPYHVFFQQLNGTSNLKLHKHTIPTFIPLSSLLRRYMATPNPESEDGDESPPRQDLPLFVRALRRELVSHAKRLDAVERLKAASVGKGSRSNRITAVTTSDPSAREVELDWADGDVAKLRIGIDGTVEKAVVRSKDGTASGRRKRRLERSILGEEGHVNGLPMRLRNANM